MSTPTEIKALAMLQAGARLELFVKTCEQVTVQAKRHVQRKAEGADLPGCSVRVVEAAEYLQKHVSMLDKARTDALQLQAAAFKLLGVSPHPGGPNVSTAFSALVTEAAEVLTECLNESPKPRPYINDIQPTMARTVAWVQSLGFKTSDSGDGVTNVEAGMECAMEIAHVFAMVDPSNAHAEADRLHAACVARGLAESRVEVNYSPNDGRAVLGLYEVTDAVLDAADSSGGGMGPAGVESDDTHCESREVQASERGPVETEAPLIDAEYAKALRKRYEGMSDKNRLHLARLHLLMEKQALNELKATARATPNEIRIATVFVRNMQKVALLLEPLALDAGPVAGEE